MPLVYSLCAIVGTMALIFSATVNLLVERLIEGTMVSIAYGEPLRNYMIEILAFMAGGTLLIVPLWFQLTVAVAGAIVLWIGVQGLVLRSEGLSLKETFTKEYWTTAQKKFKYDPDE